MYHVRLTTALMADAASQCDGKLNILGGGWDLIYAPAFPVTYPSLAVVVVVEADPAELDGARFEIKLVDEDGNPAGVSAAGQYVAGDPTLRAPGIPTAASVVLTFPGITFARPGRYRFIISVNDSELGSVGFTVRAQP